MHIIVCLPLAYISGPIALYVQADPNGYILELFIYSLIQTIKENEISSYVSLSEHPYPQTGDIQLLVALGDVGILLDV